MTVETTKTNKAAGAASNPPAKPKPKAEATPHTKVEAVHNRSQALKPLRILWLLVQKMRKKRVTNLAQSLAFSTILSLVPLLAIFFSNIGRYTRDEQTQLQIKQFISDYLIPEYINNIFLQLQSLSEKSVTLGAIGWPTLIVAGILLYAKVYSTINEIWDTYTERKWFRNSFAFFMTVILGPLLLLLVISIPPYLQTLPYYNDVAGLPWVMSAVGQMIPLLIVTAGLSVLYMYIPNTRVKGKAAIIGAFCAALLIQFSNQLVSYYLTNLAHLDVVYGSLVTVPLLLIWVFVLWVVVLTGACMTFILQNHEATEYKITDALYNDESILNNAIEVMLCLANVFENEDHNTMDLESLSFQLGMHRKRLDYIMKVLHKNHYVSMLEPDSHQKIALLQYQLGKSAHKIRLQELTGLFFAPKQHHYFSPPQAKALNFLAVHPTLANQNFTLSDLQEKSAQLSG